MMGIAIAILFCLFCTVVVYACIRAGKDDGEDNYEMFVDVNEMGEIIDFEAEAKMIREAMEEEHW